MTRNCRICGATSEAKPFYASMTSRCVDCHKAAMRARYSEKRAEIAAYDKARALLPHRVAARAAYTAAQPREKRAEYQRRSRARHPQKVWARGVLFRALRDGQLTRPECCEVCQQAGRVEGHHDDYSAPLAVRWLCKTCHRQAHEQIAGWGRKIFSARP